MNSLQSLSQWEKIAALYLLVGWCTQLPGAVFLVRGVSIGRRVGWLAFTVLFWIIPFLRAGVNRPVVILSGVAVLAWFLIFFVVPSTLGALAVFLAATFCGLWLIRPRSW